jgi:hypothetical protein
MASAWVVEHEAVGAELSQGDEGGGVDFADLAIGAPAADHHQHRPAEGVDGVDARGGDVALPQADPVAAGGDEPGRFVGVFEQAELGEGRCLTADQPGGGEGTDTDGHRGVDPGGGQQVEQRGDIGFAVELQVEQQVDAAAQGGEHIGEAHGVVGCELLEFGEAHAGDGAIDTGSALQRLVVVADEDAVAGAADIGLDGVGAGRNGGGEGLGRALAVMSGGAAMGDDEGAGRLRPIARPGGHERRLSGPSRCSGREYGCCSSRPWRARDRGPRRPAPARGNSRRGRPSR